MKSSFNILVVNPGSTSTKAALFKNERRLFEENIMHTPKELSRFSHIADQKDFRKGLILDLLKKRSVCPDSIDIVVGRGGLTRPVPGGIYRINEKMIKDVRGIKIHGREHASNLGSLIAYDIARKIGVPAVTMDPVATDEMLPIAKISGFPEIKRKSLFHALNVKAVGRRAERVLRKKRGIRLVIAHMGGGISVAAYKDGSVIDVNNAVLGMGPFTPQRAGSLPTADIVSISFSGRFTKERLLEILGKRSGLIGYLGTDDVRRIERRIKAGDKKAKLIFEAMVYQIAKEIGAYATVFKGRLDALVFTGGLSRSRMLVKMLKDRVSFLGKILVFPGEEELKTLARAGLLVLQRKVKPRTYN